MVLRSFALSLISLVLALQSGCPGKLENPERFQSTASAKASAAVTSGATTGGGMMGEGGMGGAAGGGGNGGTGG
jgi:hypothetical protein